MRTDVVAGGVLLAVVATFLVQRDVEGLAATFPDAVLVTLAVLGVWIVGRGVMARGKAPSEPTRPVDKRMLAGAATLLVGWAVAMALVGFTISSVLAFLAMIWMVRRERPAGRTLALDALVAVAVVVVCFLVFTRILLVPLPVSTVIGM